MSGFEACFSEVYQEITTAKETAITYDLSSPLMGKVAVIDLNERNFLDADRNLLGELIDKFLKLLSEDTEHNSTLEYNIKAPFSA